MRPARLLAAALLAATALAGSAAAADASPPADHVVLISLDGLRPEFYLDPTWPAPMMQQMVAEGVHAEAVRPVYPSVTYPTHTSMITGALPARHGIVYNSRFVPGRGEALWYWEAERIRVPTLWDAVRAAGRTSANVGWPVTVGAPIDHNLPEVWDPEGGLMSALRRHARPPDLVAEVEREATGRLTDDNFTIAHVTRDDRAGDAAAYLLRRYRPALLTVHLVESDQFQHQLGREDPLVRRAVAAGDRAISQMVEAAEAAGILERTAFVVAGDHGFVDRHTLLAPNVWLVEAGLRPAELTAGGPWRATFHRAGSALFLLLADPADAAAEQAVRNLLAARPAGERKLWRIVERPELDALGAAPDAVFALDLARGVDASTDAAPPAIRPKTGATHGYVPDFAQIQTGLVAWGAGVAHGLAVPQLDSVDVAPLVAALLGLDFETPDGHLPAGLLAADGAP